MGFCFASNRALKKDSCAKSTFPFRVRYPFVKRSYSSFSPKLKTNGVCQVISSALFLSFLSLPWWRSFFTPIIFLVSFYIVESPALKRSVFDPQAKEYLEKRKLHMSDEKYANTFRCLAKKLPPLLRRQVFGQTKSGLVCEAKATAWFARIFQEVEKI